MNLGENRENKTPRVTIWILVSVILALLALFLYNWGPFTHPSIEFGYYGDFNRVQRIIRTMPNVEIIDSWQHHDIDMEDFGFTVRCADGTTEKVDFYDGSRQRELASDSEFRAFLEMKFGASDASAHH